MDKRALTKAEICDRFITPALVAAGWDQGTQIRREYGFTAGRVMVRGKVAERGEKKRADYLLLHRSNLPLAVVEAKDNKHPMGGGMQQALDYAQALDVPFAFSSNGAGGLPALEADSEFILGKWSLNDSCTNLVVGTNRGGRSYN